MLDVVVLEAADHVHHGVHLADIREELVAEPLALAGALDQAGDIEELDGGGEGAFRLDEGGDSASSRGSGTWTTPVFGSMVANG